MKMVVPCTVAITRYYRVYPVVDEDAGNTEVRESAYRLILESDDQERELTPDPDMEIIEEDIQFVEPDWEGSWSEDAEREFTVLYERNKPDKEG